MAKNSMAIMAVTLLLITGSAEAAQGFFGGRPVQDGSITMRRSTIEQFDPARGQSVAARPRPDFDPIPIDMGSFQLFPALNVASYYDSNIHARPSGTKSDVVWKVNPALSATSNWGRHALAFTGFADLNTYSFNGDEGYNGGAAQIEGRYDITEKTWVAGHVGYQRNTEPRSSPSAPGAAAEPAQYNNFIAGGEIYRGLGLLKAKADYDFDYRDYSAVALTGGGTLSQSSRDRASHAFGAEADYAVSQNLRPFLRAGFGWRDYAANAARSSYGYHVNLGVKMDFGGVTLAEIYAGYKGRDYYNFATPGVNSADFGGRFLWNVTGLTSVEGEIARTIEETTLAGARAFIATGGSVTVTHELRRDVILEANASYTRNAYQGVVRNDDLFGLGLGSRYFFDRTLFGDLTYDFTARGSDVANAGFSRHVALIRFGARY